MDLTEIRKEIDAVDRELLPLFIRRMRAAEQVAACKKDGAAILNPAREEKILQGVGEAAGPEYACFAKGLYQYIFELSRGRQWQLLYSGSAFSRRLAALEAASPGEIAQPRVCAQGVEGAYSSVAASQMYPAGRLRYARRWEDVLDALEAGKADYGVLPVENSSAGSVLDVYDLLLRRRFYIVREHTIRVDHCLLGVRGASLSQVREVYSHPHALAQCPEFFHKYPQIKRVPAVNTAMAAQAVAQQGDPAKAAIASAECARLFGLDILLESVQRSKVNCTRFISVAVRPEFPADANKISLAFTLPHSTGSLFHVLARFALYGLNLTKIESRPEPDTPFEYTFYLDFTGSVKSPATLSLLSSLQQELPSFHYLGNYCDGASAAADGEK
jgi:chorismate mutase/prephenate dehydratase